jgi:hypothetical protein
MISSWNLRVNFLFFHGNVGLLEGLVVVEIFLPEVWWPLPLPWSITWTSARQRVAQRCAALDGLEYWELYRRCGSASWSMKHIATGRRQLAPNRTKLHSKAGKPQRLGIGKKGNPKNGGFSMFDYQSVAQFLAHPLKLVSNHHGSWHVDIDPCI